MHDLPGIWQLCYNNLNWSGHNNLQISMSLLSWPGWQLTFMCVNALSSHLGQLEPCFQVLQKASSWLLGAGDLTEQAASKLLFFLDWLLVQDSRLQLAFVSFPLILVSFFWAMFSHHMMCVTATRQRLKKTQRTGQIASSSSIWKPTCKSTRLG